MTFVLKIRVISMNRSFFRPNSLRGNKKIEPLGCEDSTNQHGKILGFFYKFPVENSQNLFEHF